MENQKMVVMLPPSIHPSNNPNPNMVTLKSNSLVLIGANGSGKTRLGVWLDKSKPTQTHRIGAQRSLVFEKAIKQTSYEESSTFLLYGNTKTANKTIYRWGNDQDAYYLLNDFNAVLSALVDNDNLTKGDYFSSCKRKEALGEVHDKVPNTVVDELYEIWKSIFPHRHIEIRDAKIYAFMGDKKFDAIQMSDGERVALYLISQCLVVPDNKILVIDEPEIHLHRSIMNKLWIEIEKHRPNNTFIYITHDIQFAASHVQATKIWVKSYDGSSWDWEEIKNSSLPEECLLEILGNRKNVLFVEGTAESSDTQLYRLIYPEFFVIPCGSCTKVIEYTKSMNDNDQLHHLKAFGLIDRDYRPQKEISALEKKNIRVLDVAEVENVFCIESIMNAINKHLLRTDSEYVNKAKEFTFSEFKTQLDSQIINAIIAETQFLLSIYSLDNTSMQALDQAVQNLPNNLDYDDVKKRIIDRFQKANNTKNYQEVLRIFNQKGLVKQFGSFFGLQNNAYINLALRLIKDGSDHGLIHDVKEFLPIFEADADEGNSIIDSKN